MVIKIRAMFYLLLCIGLFSLTHVFTYGESPGAVQNVEFSAIQQWGFTASWDPPLSGNSPVLYNVSITNGNNGEVYEMQFAPNSNGLYVIGHLYDGTLYFFSVTAVDALNSAGMSTSSTVRIPSCALCLINSGRTFIKMSLPPLLFPSKVSGKAVDSADAANASADNLPEGSKEVLISELQPGVLYQFEVKNIDTDDIVYISRYRVVPDPVENLQVELASTTSCIVNYEQPAEDVGQKIDGYKIVSRPTDSNGEDVLIAYSSQTSVLIENLVPGIEYTIEVQTFSGQIADLRYSSRKNATVVRVDFALVRKTNSSLTLRWEAPSDGQHVGFQIHYGSPESGDIKFMSVNASSNTSTISGLIPGQEYQVDLYLVPHEGLLSFYSSAIFQTEPNKVSGIRGTSTATSITLTWNHPTGSADSYIIDYKPSSNTAPLVTDKLSLIINGLFPGVVYEVNITTISGTAWSSPTTASFKTDSLSLGEIEVHSVTLDSIGVTWGAMPETLDVENDFVMSPPEGHRNEDISNQRVEFTNLTPGRLFTISFRYKSSMDHDGYNRSSIQQRTLPAAPYSLVVTPLEPVDYIALRLSWASPLTGEWDRIGITITQANGSSYDVLVGKMDTSYVIRGLIPYTSYTIGVKSVSGLDDTQQESEPVTQTSTTNRLLDGYLVVTSYDQDSVTVDWHWPPAVTYIASCREVGREIGDDYKGLIKPSSSSSIMRFTYGSLIPGRNYEFFIKRSDDNQLIKAFQRTVPFPPSNHTASALGAESIRVDWSGAINDFERFEITVYPSIGGNGVQYVTTVARDVFSTTIDGLLEDTLYTAEVRTISGIGESLEKSFPSAATATTEHIIMEVLTSIETVLPIGFSPILGIFDAYRYGYRKFSGDGQFLYTALSKSGPPYFNIKELKPGALYEITLDTRNGSTYTEVDRIQARTKPSKPTRLTVANLEDKSFTVSWTAPSPVDVDFIGFYLSYDPADGTIVSPLFLDKTQTSQILTGLEPATNYMITLVTVSGGGSSEETSFPEKITATTADGIPGSVNIREVSTALIRITWNKVSGVFSYTPQINPDEGKVTRTEQGAIFEGLTPGHLYTISVIWIGNSGQATQLYTKPRPPLDLTVTKTAASELEISWSPPPEGFYDSYKISYSQVLTNNIKTVTALANDDPSITLIDLISETSYDISVVSVRGTSVSEPVKTSGTTGRRVYDVLTLVDRTTTSITVRWGISADPSSEEYEIWIGPARGVQQHVTTLRLSTKTYTITNLTSGSTYLISLVINGLDRIEELEVTTYPLTPGIINILATTQTSITFSWGRSDGNFDCYSIFFFMVGADAAFLQDVPRGNNRTISKNFLTAGTKYKIQIYTKTGSTTSASTETIASTDLEQLVFEPVGKRGLRISWGNSIEAKNYLLEKISLGISLGIFMTQERYLELNDTIPGQSYTFRLSSDETPAIGLAEATYLLAPLVPSVELRAISPTSVHVTITADPLGVVNHFVVDVFAQQTSLDTGRRSSTRFDIPTEACPEVTLTDLIPGSTYTVKVIAISGETSSAAARINVSLATLTPGLVFLNERTFTSVEVKWGAVIGAFRHYVVYLLYGVTLLQVQQHGINQEHKASFEGLLPGTRYTIVLLVESDGGGLIQQSISSVTTVPETPKNMSFFSVLGNEITVSWTPVTSSIGHYELCWTPYNQVRHLSRDSTQEVISLQPLDTQYTISLYTVIGDGEDRTRSGDVTLVITLVRDETTKGSSTQAATTSNTEMISEVSFTTPVMERTDKKYYIIGIVLGFIICIVLGTYCYLRKRETGKRDSTSGLDELYENIEDIQINMHDNYPVLPPRRGQSLHSFKMKKYETSVLKSERDDANYGQTQVTDPQNGQDDDADGLTDQPSESKNEYDDVKCDQPDQATEPQCENDGTDYSQSDQATEPQNGQDDDADRGLTDQPSKSQNEYDEVNCDQPDQATEPQYENDGTDYSQSDQATEPQNGQDDHADGLTDQPSETKNEYDDVKCDQSDQATEPQYQNDGMNYVQSNQAREPQYGNNGMNYGQSEQGTKPQNEHAGMNCGPSDQAIEPQYASHGMNYDQSDQETEQQYGHDVVNYGQSNKAKEPQYGHDGMNCSPSDQPSEQENENEDVKYGKTDQATESRNCDVEMNCITSEDRTGPSSFVNMHCIALESHLSSGNYNEYSKGPVSDNDVLAYINAKFADDNRDRVLVTKPPCEKSKSLSSPTERRDVTVGPMGDADPVSNP